MTALDKAFNEVQKLVTKFDSNIKHYMDAHYSEAEARQDFIDEFFIALGWDVRHKDQTNPYEQEVKIELSQKQQNESARKRADYAFYLAPNHKDEIFFVEAKKPSVLITRNEQHYFQTIRYGWNAGCPISVLTDFEEFVIVDCRATPNIKYSLNGQHKTYKYTDYTNKEKFAEIYWVFSREAVANKSIEKYAATLGKAKGKVTQKALFKGGYQTIDDSFLEYIDGIRLNLAQAFKKNDDSLDGEQLTEAVQRTVDRLVFIRFLEDKFIEAEQHVNEWTGWKDFIADCRKLDAKYNGVVFKKHFIDEQDFAGAEEKLFVDICQDISSLNSPYDFNYIPIHILGSIYERFLGKVIRTTAKKVFVEEKPEVRKAGGVYYTPKYIVDYIVQNTVGKQIAGKTPKQITELHFADIACGSGSFLIGVYDYLLDYHRNFYNNLLNEEATFRILQDIKFKNKKGAILEDNGNVEYRDGQWSLTLKLKQNILLNNIYGVDVDYQAVEVTQLSLFLKMLEDETLSSTSAFTAFSKVLPDLTKNIVCGNSLIGYDIMSMNGGLFEDVELKKLNPMDYTAAFPKIMRNGGFDGIVGNPPWSSKMPNEYVSYISNKYKIDGKNVNLFAPFVIRGYKDLLNVQGITALLIPKVFIKNTSYTSIRKDIIDNYSLLELTDFGKFPGVASDCVVSFIKKEKPTNTTAKIFLENELIEQTEFKQKLIAKSSIYAFSTSTNNATTLVLEKIVKGCKPLIEFSKIKRGIELGQQAVLAECTHCNSWNEAGEKYYATKQKVCKKCKSIITKDAKTTTISHRSKWDGFVIPCISGRDVSRNLILDYYYIRKNLKGIDYKNEIFEGDRIYLKRIATKPECVFLSNDELCYAFNTVYSVYQCKIDTKFILGILNAKAMGFFYEKSYNLGMNLTSQITIEYLKTLPIPLINFKNPQQKQQHDSIVHCVTQLLAAKQKQAQAKEGRDKEFITNQCNALDTQIDNLVYELYGLTNEEIKIVEGG